MKARWGGDLKVKDGIEVFDHIEQFLDVISVGH